MRLADSKTQLRCDYCGADWYPEPNEDGIQVLGEPAAVNCPVCKAPLLHAVVGSNPVLYCQPCGGMLIGMEEFVLVIDELRSRRFAPSVPQAHADWRELDRKIACPQCGQPMDSHPYAGPGNIIIESCETCSVNWLDRGELQRVVRAPDHHYPE
jgi:Zn-finger nucleic acid-binding protein